MNFSSRPAATLTAIMLSVVMSFACNRQTPTTENSGESSSGSSGTAGSSGSSGMAGNRESSGSSDRSAAQENPEPSSGSSVSNAASATGTAVTDTLLTGKVKSAFLADSDLKSMGISVDSNDGEVTLTGTLANQAQIDRAVSVASSVSGVKSVRNRLAIKR